MDRPAEHGAHPGGASLVVIDPHGQRTRVPIEPLPFHIGRQPESDLILRDTRVSRSHARILVENGRHVIEDIGSRHGTYVNGKKIARHELASSDKIDFGAQDSYQLIFALDGGEMKRLMEQMSASEKAPPLGSGRESTKAARDIGLGAHAAGFVFNRRRAGFGGGYGANDYRGGARLSHAAPGARPGDARGAPPSWEALT